MRKDPFRPGPDYNAADHFEPSPDLSAEEISLGFVRKLRLDVRHVGRQRPDNLRPLTVEEMARFGEEGGMYEDKGNGEGRFWSAQMVAELTGCGKVTTLLPAHAEALARHVIEPRTIRCMCCGQLPPIRAFVWNGTDDRLGQ